MRLCQLALKELHFFRDPNHLAHWGAFSLSDTQTHSHTQSQLDTFIKMWICLFAARLNRFQVWTRWARGGGIELLMNCLWHELTPVFLTSRASLQRFYNKNDFGNDSLSGETINYDRWPKHQGDFFTAVPSISFLVSLFLYYPSPWLPSC